MKKYLIALWIVVMAVVCLLACGQEEVQTGKKMKIVTTIFPEYDWVKEILGNDSDAELTLLLDDGVDLHSYQPTAEDMMKIAECDLFIYVGGESDAWVEDAWKETDGKKQKSLCLLDVLGERAKNEELVEGMQEETHEQEEDGHEEEKDEHVWLSLKNAQILSNAIADTLAQMDAENADTYRQNVSDYIEKLKELDAQYEETVQSASRKTMVFADRFPFAYLADDYGLEYYAAFSGCSAETEASFETITFLAKKVDELGLDTVMTIDKSDDKIAKTVIESTKEKNQTILKLDSLQSADMEDVSEGVSYLSVMEHNLEVLREALE